MRLVTLEILGFIGRVRPWLFAPDAAVLRRRKGQSTVEYLLMLAVVASATLIFTILFHKKLLGGIFTLAGMIIGAGTPK